MTIECLFTEEELRGGNRRCRTQSLFWENKRIYGDVCKPLYNLKAKDWEGTLSMYKIYMSYDNEYDAAMRILGDWAHWEVLCAHKPFMKKLEKWRIERTIREEALAHNVLIQAAKDGNVPAAKTLLLESKKVNNVGRPTKQQVTQAAKNQAELDEFLVHSIGKPRNVA